MTFHLLSLMRPPVMLSQHSMDCTALLVISHMFVQYIKDSTDWVVPQSVRQYHYGFPSRKVLVTLLSCLLGYCLHSERIACRIDFNIYLLEQSVSVLDGYFGLNAMQTAQLNAIKLVLLLKAIHNVLASITLKSLLPHSDMQLFAPLSL